MKQLLTKNEKNEREVHDENLHPLNVQNVKAYFRILRLRLMAGLFIGFLIPHALLSAYFHLQFNSTLKKSGKLSLSAIAESQKNTLDLFLQERVVNLLNLFHSREFSLSPDSRKMAHYLENIRQASDAFVDVGFLNGKGIQTGYSGPYPELLGKDYSHELWFRTLMNQNSDYLISDIYLGFRKKPHFTIAIRQKIDGNPYVMRSTLDPDKFFMFLRSIQHGREVDSTLVNEYGYYQVVDPHTGKILSRSDVIPPEDSGSGVVEVTREGEPYLVAYTWLSETSWALLVSQPLSVAHAGMYRARQVLIGSLVVIIISIGLIIYISTRKLINRAQATAERGLNLQHQLFHASKLAAVGELSTGIAHEINNPLAIIIATTGVIKDMLNPDFHLDASPEAIKAELSVIDSAAFRAKRITQQLLDFGRKSQPVMVLCNVHSILDDVLVNFKEREFQKKHIEIVKCYSPDVPEILTDPDAIRQVFLNLLNNAGDAISGPGTIAVSSVLMDGFVKVTVKDSGEGIEPEYLKRIFDPFFTTKDVGKGTGLGLSVSRNIVEIMGGRIDVVSVKGVGSSFTVSLPAGRPGSEK
jgi:two-component system NtrC family sensor kinase